MTPLVKSVRMSTKGQIVIPLAIRRRMSIKPGDNLVVIGGESEARLMTAKRYAESLRGIARGIYGRTREDVYAYVREQRRARPR